ncbi:MAG: hypothetical protein K9N11_10065 [Lentisphaeria bacterium]|nr:hypothetical protein [Candidatus Neomarinimicrobiota bacterium]MCF7843177.1 hypothetical protein [Lentisphaeria bacterium]
MKSAIVKTLLGLLLWGSASPVLGAFDQPTYDARVLAAGNVRSTLSAIANPALLGSDHPVTIGISGTNYVANLNIWGSGLTMQGRIASQPVSFSATIFGDEVYQEHTLQAGSGFQIFPLLAVGASFQIRHVAIKNYYSHMGGGISVGGRILLRPDVILGILWQNVIQKPLVTSVPEPEIFSIGLRYDSPLLALALGLEKDAQLPLNGQVGVFSTWSDWWGVGVGYESGMAAFTIGPHLNWSVWSLAYAWQWRAHLPPRQSFSLHYTF